TPAANAAGWHKGDVVVMLSATDPAPGAGVKEIRHAQTSGPLTAAAGSNVQVSVAGEGTITLRYLAADNAGNRKPSAHWCYISIAQPHRSSTPARRRSTRWTNSSTSLARQATTSPVSLAQRARTSAGPPTLFQLAAPPSRRRPPIEPETPAT